MLNPGEGHFSEWYSKNDVEQREFVFRDFGDFLFIVKQTKESHKVFRLRPSFDGSIEDIELVTKEDMCCKALRTEYTNELGFKHCNEGESGCKCCN
jgi:hypothetical protein